MMKKILGMLILVGCLVTFANAQTVNANKVPTAVKATFANLHPSTRVTWEMEKSNYEEGFIANGQSNL